MLSTRVLAWCQKCCRKGRQLHSTLHKRARNLALNNDIVCVSEEVSQALHLGSPVVALETTIVTHGMPYPDNLQMATEVEKLIRDKGVTPATIGIIRGKLCIGLSQSQLEYLADHSTQSVKTSRRDFPYVISQKLNGGTTVSGTMVAAHMAGIHVFVTGGIGGVHRGAEDSMDISADLTELGRTPVAVVSAGIKSILDIGRTLEYLETEGVCVASYGESHDFPAFFTRQSGYKAPYNVCSAAQTASLIDTTLRLGLQSGFLFAVPIPTEYEADGQMIEAAIQSSVAESVKAGVRGKDITPFILQRVNEITAGKSLEANIHLVKNNASVGSDITMALSRLQNNNGEGMKSSKGLVKERNSVINKYQGQGKKTDPKDIVVIGGSIVDFYARLKQTDLQTNGATYPGTVQQQFGGVGRNIADCLTRLGVSPLFISAIGKDSHQAAYQAYCKHMDLSGVAVLDDVSTATYVAILHHTGELVFGIGDMDIHSMITKKHISKFEEDIMSAKLVCIDGNLTVETIDHVCSLCHHHHIPVWFEPADLSKASKVFQTSLPCPVTYTSPNLNELRAMASYLGNQTAINSANSDDLDKSSVIEESIDLLRVVAEKTPVVMVTLGKHGAILCRHGDRHDKFPVRGHSLKFLADEI